MPISSGSTMFSWPRARLWDTWAGGSCCTAPALPRRPCTPPPLRAAPRHGRRGCRPGAPPLRAQAGRRRPRAARPCVRPADGAADVPPVGWTSDGASSVLGQLRSAVGVVLGRTGDFAWLFPAHTALRPCTPRSVPGCVVKSSLGRASEKAALSPWPHLGLIGRAKSWPRWPRSVPGLHVASSAARSILGSSWPSAGGLVGRDPSLGLLGCNPPVGLVWPRSARWPRRPRFAHQPNLATARP
jgi:hypothetical protein